MITIVICCLTTAFIFFWIGFFVAPTKIVEPQELSYELKRIINQEAIEVQGHMRRVELMRANRRTQRFDGGKPAVVHKMRRRKRTNLPPH